MSGITLELELTNKCNCSCAMCPRDAMSRPLGEMQEETFRRILSEATAANIKKIGFAGFGEPLLNRRIVDFVHYIKEADSSISVSFSTNAALLDEQKALQLLLAGLDRFTVSFDGWDPESHDFFMGKSFDKTVQNIITVFNLTQALGKGAINIAPILMKKQTEVEIEKIYEFFRGKGLTGENFPGHYLVHNRAGYFSDPALIDEEFLTARNIIKYPAGDIICLWALNNNWIDWQGRHHLCCNDIQDIAVLGGIAELGFDEASAIKRRMLLAGTPALCTNCDFPFTLGYRTGYIFRSDLQSQ